MSSIRLNTIQSRAMTVLAIVLISMIASLAPAHAADGEIIDQGSNEVGNVYTSEGRLRANFDNIGDCPTGIQTCRVQVRWRYDNLDDYNPFWKESGWMNIPAGRDYASFCPGSGRYRAELQMRLYWENPGKKTVELWGSNERVTTLGGDVVYRVLGRAFYNYTNKTGFRGGVKMETTTSTSDAGKVTTAATSAGTSMRPTCG